MIGEISASTFRCGTQVLPVGTASQQAGKAVDIFPAQ